jgi:hypothetical protein
MLILASGGGCRKSASNASNAQSQSTNHPSTINHQPSTTTLARFHWLGIQRLARETNADYFMSVWNLPESKQLVAQTLDKLAVALTGEQSEVVVSNQVLVTSNRVSASGSPPRITNQLSTINYHLSPANQPLSSKLRPLLEDLVQAESYFELRQATNQPCELALAIRLDDQRAELWTSNLTAVLGSMTNVQSLPASSNCYAWRLPLGPRPSRLGLARAGQWTLLGIAAETNRLLAEWSQRIRADHAPVSGTGSRAATNYWLDADVDLGRLAGALKTGQASPPAPSAAGNEAGTPALLSWPAGLPKLAATVIGVGGEVRMVGELKFAEPLPLQETAWNIPTNLVYQRLISFTAIRDFQPWLASQKVWKDLGLGAAPNQVFFWAREGLPFLSYCAVPFPGATNCVARLTERLMTEGNAWMTTNGMGRFLRSEQTNGVVLSVPFMEPYLEPVKVGGNDYVLGGLLHQGPGTNSLAPLVLFQEITRRTNLVAYDWELTGPRLDTWLHIGQLIRLISFRDRLRPESASAKWFKEAAPRLGNCATAVTRTAPDELSFVRRSAIGFTSVELHLLADWLESPNFPHGFYSRAVHRPAPPARNRSGTNSVPTPLPKR